MFRFAFILACVLSGFSLSTFSWADQINIDLTVPKLDAQPYHKPYVSIWLETPKRKGVETLSIWHYQEKEDWLKDLRQWWRKLGRKNRDFDSVASATRKPDTYALSFSPEVAAGEYRLCFEASREDGGREFLHQTITLGAQETQSFTLKGAHELGDIHITISGKNP